MAEPSAVIGHEGILARLLAAHTEGNLGHALLLTGPTGAGKTTLALALAEQLLDGTSWPGGLRAHPDLWLEDSDDESVGIDRIRPGGKSDARPVLQETMSLRTYAGGMRVAILARAERLTEPAADTLLKTLEEPPPGTVIVLCAPSAEMLPATVVSRCRAWPVGIVAPDRIAAWLGESGVPDRLARLAAVLSAGRPGRARRLATEPGALRDEVGALHAFLAVGGGGPGGALEAAGRLTPGGGAEGRERALLLLAVWAAFVRDAAVEAAGAPELRVWGDYANAVERWAGNLGTARLTEILGLLLRTAAEIAAYALPRLAFEALFLEVFGGQGAPPAVDMPATPAAMADAPAASAAAAKPKRAPARRR